ncbi:hypothetical protein [Frondihabitans sp. PhB188]|uniref:hypothetical protein n=1 Tax=Frondihabitans sp. PhB188 TaxID=2485200 RepID=UPI0013153E86|nr:hypothetical protein [Frondihabitans sp. PhB188]
MTAQDDNPAGNQGDTVHTPANPDGKETIAEIAMSVAAKSHDLNARLRQGDE